MVFIPFEAEQDIGALTNGTVLSFGMLPATLGEDFFLVGVKATWAVRSQTTAEGPLVVGFAHSDLSVGEVAEALDASVTDPDDIIANERSRRPVRRVGKFPGLSTDEVLNDGLSVITRAKFSVGDGFNVSAFAQNRSGATLTTGTTVVIDGLLYGRWQR